MALPLPNLDDRRWADLVEEGRALIPVYASEWTDHNLHDPGITLLELFAWIAEMDLYRANRIPDARRRKFLGLAGVEPRPPRGALTAVGFRVAGAAAAPLPAGLELEGDDPFGRPVRFRTLEAITAVPGTLEAIQTGGVGELSDLTARWRRGQSVQPLGADPAQGSAFYLGLEFDSTGPPSERVSLYFAVSGDDGEEGRRLAEEAQTAAATCRAAGPLVRCDGAPAEESVAEEPEDAGPTPPHHSVRLVWEAHTGSGLWQRLDPAAVDDGTRALTLSGRVELRLPAGMTTGRLGQVDTELYYVRCRLAAGAYDEAPELEAVALNGVAVEQAVPAVDSWTIAAGADVSGPEPTAGQRAVFDADWDSRGEITRLAFGAAGGPSLRVLDYRAATSSETGSLSVAAEKLGRGLGGPSQELDVAAPLVAGSPFVLVTREAGHWRFWSERADFHASGRADAHYTLDRDEGRVRFGDGEHGRALPQGAVVCAVYDTTRGRAGNLAAGRIDRLAESPWNGALVPDSGALATRIEAVDQPLAAAGGRAGETLDQAASRAFELVTSTSRAVTLADHERLAFETPGVRLARAAARASLHPAFPCFRAPGVVTVMVLPFLPSRRPQPSPELLHAVAAHLKPRRVLGTRVEVVAPTYVELSVRATVRACAGVSRSGLEQRLRDALDAFFHPLTGGPDGTGWPFGRDVYRSEVLQTLDETAGADHVLALELLDADGQASCGNLCLPPDGLVAAGQHEIEVV